MENKKMIFELCAGRHATPAQGNAIFENVVENVFDFVSLRDIVKEKLRCCSELDLYVTGLTPVLIAVLNYCIEYNIQCTLYHFNRDSGEYTPQTVYVYYNRECTCPGHWGC